VVARAAVTIALVSPARAAIGPELPLGMIRCRVTDNRGGRTDAAVHARPALLDVTGRGRRSGRTPSVADALGGQDGGRDDSDACARCQVSPKRGSALLRLNVHLLRLSCSESTAPHLGLVLIWRTAYSLVISVGHDLVAECGAIEPPCRIRAT